MLSMAHHRTVVEAVYSIPIVSYRVLCVVMTAMLMWMRVMKEDVYTTTIDVIEVIVIVMN